MKTAVSIPDSLFANAERLAKALEKSRSRLYSDALREYIARHSPDRVTEALDNICDDAEDTNARFVRAAARRTLERSDW